MNKKIKRLALIILMILACAILFIACGNTIDTPDPVITYQYNIDMDLDKGLEDAPNGYYYLPAITVDKLSDGVKTDSAQYTGNITMDENEFLYYENGIFYQKDYATIEFSTTVTINLARVLGDNADGSVQFSFLIKKLYVKATAIELFIDSQGVLYSTDFFAAGAVSVNVDFTPSNTSYKDYRNLIHTVEYVIKDGEKIIENLEDYANISDTGLLSLVDNGLYIGDKIGVKAKTIKEGVESAILEIDVIKIPVQWVGLSLNETRVVSGENAYYDYSQSSENLIVVSCEPWNATLRDDVVFTIVNAEECPFVSIVANEHGGFKIVIDDETFVRYKMLEFYVTVDGIQSNTVKVYIH